MPISRDEISAAVDDYLRVHRGEAERLGPLTTALARADDPTSRHSLPGHVTVNAVLVDPDNRVLHIHHLALDRWLTPGGHCEAEDSSLFGAALRELEEETGISRQHIIPSIFGRTPIDIDVHAIPANDAKGEPAHWHYDFRFVLRTRRGVDVGRLQAEEITDAAWLPLADATSPEIVRKLTLVL
jgi:8-oxo-dGTP pyrophosphatase MutT (NUDIX family)